MIEAGNVMTDFADSVGLARRPLPHGSLAAIPPRTLVVLDAVPASSRPGGTGNTLNRCDRPGGHHQDPLGPVRT
jgi:hypothetical protein